MYETCRRLKPVLGDRAEALWLLHAGQKDPKKRAQIEAQLRILEAKLLGKSLDPKPVFPPPSADQASGDFVLGFVHYAGSPLYPAGVSRKELTQHLVVFGRSGAGKTNLGFLLLQAFSEAAVPFLVFDWKRNYRDVLREPWGRDVALFTVGRDVAPFRFNPLIPPPGVRPDSYLPKLCEVLAHSHFLGEGVMYVLLRSLDALYRRSGVYTGQVSAYPTFQDLLSELRAQQVKGREQLWMASTLRAVDSLCYGETGEVVNIQASLDLERFLSAPVVLELDALSHSSKLFLAESLMLWVHLYRMAHAERDQLRHVLFIEEAHHLLHRHQRDGSASGESVMEVIIREIRELGEGLVMLDQMPSLFSQPALANTYTTVAFNLKSSDDVRAVGNAMLLSPDQFGYLGQLEVGEAVVKLQGRYMLPFLVHVPLSGVRKGCVSDSWLQQRSFVLDLGVPPVSCSLPADQRVFPGFPGSGTPLPPGARGNSSKPKAAPAADLSADARLLLEDAADHPLATVTERYRRLGFSQGQGSRVQQKLVELGHLQPVQVSTGSGKVVLLEPTDLSRPLLKSWGKCAAESPRFGGLPHAFWRHRVAEALRADGWDTEEEVSLGDARAVDVLATRDGRRLAVEVETGKSDAVGNLRKCLDAGFDEVWLLFTGREALAKARSDAEGAGLVHDHVKLLHVRELSRLCGEGR